ncbi:zinc finger protein 865 [Drosophila grimshawi]|uniref:GH24154 n=1 Tax=Drosophila grimshawi TaxID=7222 RepID=B4JNE3_DROGR|nr:zinc finger protein 865 [Drosophila grimshawi]EDV92236.1 GH24154 [Drosophila grimshawi]
MICRLCLNALDEQNAVLLFAGADKEANENKTIPENYLVQLISTHLYLCLSRDDAISTSICTDCCVQLESFHNFWKLVEHKQTTLCSQFLEIDCDVNWSEEGDVDQQQQLQQQQQQQQQHHQLAAIIDFKQEPEPELDADETPAVYDAIVKDETEFHESYLKVDPKAAAAANKFPCMFCEKSFKMRRYLEEHVATHTGDRPIACAYCNTAFRCRSNMYTHVKTKHNTQWQKARADRESAKINSNNNVQIQRGVNGDSDKFALDAITLSTSEPQTNEQQQQQDILNKVVAAQPPLPAATPLKIEATAPLPSPPPLSIVKCEPMEAINLTVAKVCPPTIPAKRVTRSSRRKTHSPKKVQHTERSASASEDSSNDADLADLHKKRLKTELRTCKENELILANYNAVAAVVAAAAANHHHNNQQQQQRLCATIMQQHQEQLLTAMAAVSTSASTSTGTSSLATAAAAAAAAVALSTQSSTPTITPAPAAVASASACVSVPAPALPNAEEPYTCSICGQQLRNQRALNNHLHNKHNTMPGSSPSHSLALSICPNCGELPGQNHRCHSKAKYACDICGKSFKMKRYLEEHFATHTGVKLHTCAFCPTEFRSKSNMYHHTKRKHKLEWERSRASRNAAKSAAHVEQQQPPMQSQSQPEDSATNS